MTKKTKTIWRLANRPTPSEVELLFKSGLLNKEEAREILISLETEEDRNKKSLQEEIKFLRDLIAKLTTNRSVIVESIKYVEKPYRNQDWYQPYIQYYSAPSVIGGLTYTTTGGGVSASSTSAAYSLNAAGGSSSLTNLSAASAAQQSLSGNVPSFTDIKTF